MEPQERWEQWTLRGKSSRYAEGRGNRPEPTLRVRMGVGALATCLFPPSIPGHLANPPAEVTKMLPPCHLVTVHLQLTSQQRYQPPGGTELD